MIDIESKCQEYAKNATPTYINGDFDRYAIAQSFEDGATWRINSVWHDITEKPEKNNIIFILDNDGDIDLWCTMPGDTTNTFKTLGAIAWAYQKDLMPMPTKRIFKWKINKRNYLLTTMEDKI